MEKKEKRSGAKINVPGRYSLITLIGNSEISIEGLRGILDYDSELLRINTVSGIVALTGCKLTIEAMTPEEVYIKGKITSVEFI